TGGPRRPPARRARLAGWRHGRTVPAGAAAVPGSGARLPALEHARAGGRAATPVGGLVQGLVGGDLELFDRVPCLPRQVDPAVGAHRALHLALVLWAVGRARVDVEAYGGGITAVALVEPAPGPGAVHHRRLGVVHPRKLPRQADTSKVEFPAA